MSKDSWLDAATASIFGHGLTTLLLAMRMSKINIEQMTVARKAGSAGAKTAAAKFLQSPYYRSWSRAQLNNTEYAPTLSLLCLCVKLKAESRRRALTWSEAAACFSSWFFSIIFVYACATQGKVEHHKMRPGQGGMSPLRPLGAFGRYAAFAFLLFELLRPEADKRRLGGIQFKQ